ncbi:MAG TPA: VWA domain-containing protein [Acidobacteriota bacterium]|nr:VWA domain-containing protein [Acidobacteriota bacterium]
MSVLLLLIPYFWLGSPPEAVPSFRVDADFIRVPVTVLDQSGRTVPNLTAEDFRLYDEGEPRPIANFVMDQSPLNVVILIDTSGSVQDELDEIKRASLLFASVFDRDDRIAVMSFSDRIEVLRSWTSDQRAVRRAVNRLERGFRTSLFDSLLHAVREKLDGASGKKAILLWTDGLDNESRHTYDDALNELVASDVSLYIVSRSRLVQAKVGESARVEFLQRVMQNVLDDEESFVDVYFREKEASLNLLAETTGGRVFYPEKLIELRRYYVQVARELKSQYLLAFPPPQQSEIEFRRIRVECKRPATEVHHREMYRFP